MVLIVADHLLLHALIAVINYDIMRSSISHDGARRLGVFGRDLPLMTHAFFAVLFLRWVIIALHHEQDMRKMGGLRKYMWTY